MKTLGAGFRNSFWVEASQEGPAAALTMLPISSQVKLVHIYCLFKFSALYNANVTPNRAEKRKSVIWGCLGIFQMQFSGFVVSLCEPARLAARVEPRFRWNLYLPEIANDQDGHRQGAERHGIANRVNEIQPIEKMLL